MEPHELVFQLVTRTGKSTLQVAREMHKASFQGTLHKFINGQVPSPTRSTAEKIAKYFSLPIDALYDKAVATTAAAERGVLRPGRAELGVAEPNGIYQAAVMPRRKISTALEERIERLSAEQIKGLEGVVAAYLDAVAPRRTAKKTGT